MAQVGIGLSAGALAVGAAVALPADAPLGPRTASGAQRLVAFDDCDELTKWYIRQALPKVTAYGFGHVWPIMYAEDLSAVRQTGQAAAAPATGSVGSSATGTNVQEEGVDEPDVAKRLGDGYVVSIDGRDLVVTDVTASAPAEVSRLELPDHRWSSYELLVVGDRVLVLGTKVRYGDWIPDDVVVAPRLSAPMLDDYYGGTSAALSSLTTVDLTDPSTPEVVNRDVIEGQIQAAREHDGTVRVVTTTTPTPDLDFVTPYGPLTRAEARAQNEELVAESTAADWLPWRWLGHTGNTGEPLVDCTQVEHPSTAAGLGTITVVTLDPDDPADFATTAVSADGSRVYASDDRLYVSTVDDGWGWGGAEADGPGRQTEIHAFSTDGDTTAYVASGRVDGNVASQWSFSEYDGLLRVASSLGPVWNPSETIVTVLEEDGDELVPVGTVGGMGPDEEVKSVRWFGDYAVVVTFRQIDPLYLLDLSEPTEPVVTDELKVPGFSQYLHPVGDSIVLGIGQMAARDSQGVQASTFDLTDLRRLDQVVFAEATFAAVGTDARSFTYLPEEQLALFPTSSWRLGQPVQLEIVSVGAGGRLTTVEEVELRGGGWYTVRTLPLDDARVALVQGGSVIEILDTATFIG
jgi:hypothetical protein